MVKVCDYLGREIREIISTGKLALNVMQLR